MTKRRRHTPRPKGHRPIDRRWIAAPLLVAVAAAGALSGKAIGSVSMLRPSDDRPAVSTPERPPLAPDRSGQEPLPDHYPLVTPTGTVPVVALALHGRLRQTGERWSDVPDRVPLEAEAEAEWELSEAEIDHLAQWQPAPSAPPRSRVAAASAQPAPPEPQAETIAPAETRRPVHATGAVRIEPADE